MTTKLKWTTEDYKLDDGTPISNYIAEVDHGLVDSSGRKIGGFAVVEPAYDRVHTDDSVWPKRVYNGKWTVRLAATRDGNKFGAYVHPGKARYATADAAKAAAPALLAKQRERYAKLYGAKS